MVRRNVETTGNVGNVLFQQNTPLKQGAIVQWLAIEVDDVKHHKALHSL